MKRFGIRLLIFIFPFFLLTILLTLSSLYIGEALPVSTVIEMQRDGLPIIYYPNWTRQDIMYYKYLATTLHKPEILILGSSRMFQFRSEFFTEEPELVYNASVPGLDPNEIARFVSALGEANSLPNILIITIDLPYLNATESDKSNDRVPRIVPPLSFTFDYIASNLSNTAREWLIKPATILVHLKNSRPNANLRYFGIYAMTNANGFRNDGSLYFGSVETDMPKRLAANKQDLANSREAFEIGQELNQATLADLEQLLQFAEDNNIQVVAVLPPYRQEFFDKMIESGNYGYIDKAIPELEGLFSRHNASLFNFTDPKTVGGQDSELIDSWHSGELLSLRMQTVIVQALPKLFEPYTNLVSLQAMIDSADSAFFIFRDNF